MKTYKIVADVDIPRVPNYLLYSNGSGKIPLSGVSEKSLREIGRLWTERLIERAREQATGS